MNINKASLALDIDGQMCWAILDGIDLNLMVNCIAKLREDGLLKVVKAPEDFKWSSLKENFQ